MAIRTAILGYGRSGSYLHADPIEKLQDFEMVAVCDIDKERQKQAHSRFGCRIYDDYQKMLKQEKLDLVSIITRSDQHCQMTCECLQAGVNVLVTKPWCLNEDEAQRMIRTAEKSGKLLAPWLPARWGSDVKRLREIIAAGTIGKVFCLRRGVYSFGIRNDWQTEKRYGGGYVLNWGPHLVDPPVYLLKAQVKSVYASLKQVINPGDVEDVFFTVLNLDNGVTVHAEYNIAVEGLPNWFIQGDKGTIIVQGSELTIHTAALSAPEDPTKTSLMQAKAGVSHEKLSGELYGNSETIYRELAQALRREKKFPVTPQDALALTKILDAIKISATENRVVNIK